MKANFIFFLMTLFASVANGQNPKWVVYDTSNSGLPDNSVLAISIDRFNNKWIGTIYGGVAKFDNTNWTIYNTSNSGLFSHNTQAVYVDSNDNKWFGSGWNGKVSKFDDETWVVYDAANTNSVLSNDGRTSKFVFSNGKLYIGTWVFGLKVFDGNIWQNIETPHLYMISDMTKDNQGNIWIASEDDGLKKYDGSTWTNYKSSNSSLSSNALTSIAIEANGTIWVTTKNDGLVKISGNNWTVYNTSNSGIPSNSLKVIAIDKSNNKWIATDYDATGNIEGLIKFDDSNWTVYNTSNSEIPSNLVTSIVVDDYNNKWIGTNNYGMVVFNEDGAVLSKKEISNVETVSLVYPNPFKSEIIIELFNKEQNTIVLYNMLGQEVLRQSFRKSTRINTTQLSKGLYLYELNDNKGKFKTGKLVKL